MSRLRRSAARLLAVWPLGSLLLLAALAAARPLTAGYPGAAVAAPILVMVPGSLTLGAVAGRARRPRGPLFACWAVLLGLCWTVFAALALSVLTAAITAASMYWCLLGISAALAAAAQLRLLLARAPRGVRAVSVPGPAGAWPAAGVAGHPERPGGGGFHAAMAVAAGVALLAGGTYLTDHLPRPARPGYTWLAWTGPQAGRVISIGRGGSRLHFQIVRRAPGTASFRLTAAWAGATRRPLAGPLTIRVRPGRAYRGTLLVPPPPRACTYRIALMLRADRQRDPLTGKPRVWAISADVRRAGTPAKPCG
ncbi:MAG: hypothetical protein ACM32E_14915 [Gemmatimonadota bacterium]